MIHFLHQLSEQLRQRTSQPVRYYSKRELQAILDEKVADEIVAEVLAKNRVTV